MVYYFTANLKILAQATSKNKKKQWWLLPGYHGWAGRSSPAPSCGGGVVNEYGKVGGNGNRRNAERENERSVVMEIGLSGTVSK